MRWSRCPAAADREKSDRGPARECNAEAHERDSEPVARRTTADAVLAAPGEQPADLHVHGLGYVSVDTVQPQRHIPTTQPRWFTRPPINDRHAGDAMRVARHIDRLRSEQLRKSESGQEHQDGDRDAVCKTRSHVHRMVIDKSRPLLEGSASPFCGTKAFQLRRQPAQTPTRNRADREIRFASIGEAHPKRRIGNPGAHADAVDLRPRRH